MYSMLGYVVGMHANIKAKWLLKSPSLLSNNSPFVLNCVVYSIIDLAKIYETLRIFAYYTCSVLIS